jgi:tetrahydromethanopterin S-methyltransferase subunit G
VRTFGARFDDVNSRFDDINNRFDGINHRFDAVDRRIDDLRTDLGGRMDRIERRLETVGGTTLETGRDS